MDWVGLVKARLQGAIKLLASLLDAVLVEVVHVHPLVRIMAETLALNGLDVLRVAAAGDTITFATHSNAERDPFRYFAPPDAP